jgi:hypothetical protein
MGTSRFFRGKKTYNSERIAAAAAAGGGDALDAFESD